MDFIRQLNSFILSPIMFAMLFLCGGILLLRLKFYPLSSPQKIIKALFSGNKASSFKAMTLALAGTVGVGNIVGVATAVDMGGAGAVFWMLVSSVAAMIIKYSEIVLALLYRRRNKETYHGGTAYYIKYGVGSPFLAYIFSALTVTASFCVGNTVQVNAAAEAGSKILGINKICIGIFIGAAAFLVIYKGINSISAFTVKLVPVMSVGYTLLSLIIIVSNFDLIPGIVSNIISDAFNPHAMSSGIIGFVTMKSIRYGVVRGIGSNEAGCGTAPTAHATADTDSPARQGCWGIAEVFVDTVLLCSITALVILIYPENAGRYNGMMLAIKSYEAFYGSWVAYPLFAAVLCFALSTVICWSFYATESLNFLKLEFTQKPYIFIYCIACVVGSVMSLDAVWQLSDFCVSVMVIINTVCIIKLSRKVGIEKI